MNGKGFFALYHSYFVKNGGTRAVLFFAKKGLLWPMWKEVLKNPFRRQSYKNAYIVALNKVEPLLRSQFAPIMHSQREVYAKLSLKHERSKKVWFCWLQGIESAPLVVKACYSSLQKHLIDRDILLIDNNNWKDYVTLPDYIIQKWERKLIPSPLFSDLIRLQLLIKYGGSWIDSTVLCTGFTPQNEKISKSFLDADLFMFQYTRPGSSQWGGIGNWFITSCTNNEVLLVLRDMLFAYWREYDCVSDYYIFHLFFSMLREVYPEEINSMPYGYAGNSIALGYHLGDKFEAAKWERVTSKVCFHKLAHTVRRSVDQDNDNYYHHIVDGDSAQNCYSNESFLIVP